MIEALPSRQNVALMPRLRSATTQRHRPIAALTYDPNPQGEWTKLDYLLEDAFLTMDREICSMCNNAIWLCHSTDNRIEFKLSKRTCFARQDLDNASKNDKQNSKLDPGEYLVAKPVGLDDNRGNYEPLPPRHEAYKSVPTD